MDHFTALFTHHDGAWLSHDGRVRLVRQRAGVWAVIDPEQVSGGMSFNEARWAAMDRLWVLDHR